MTWNRFFNSGNPLQKRFRNFSDTEYNDLVGVLSHVTEINKQSGGLKYADWIVLHFGSEGDYNKYASTLVAKINTVLRDGKYNPRSGQVDNWDVCVDNSVDYNPNHTNVRFETLPSGASQSKRDQRRNRADDWITNLSVIKSGGTIDGYSPSDPLTGYTKTGKAVKFTKVYNNSAVPVNEVPPTVDPRTQGVTGSDDEEAYSDWLDSLKNSKGKEEESIFTTSNIIIGAGLLILLFVMFSGGKKTAAAAPAN